MSEYSPFFSCDNIESFSFYHSAPPEAAETQRDADGRRLGGRRVSALQGKHFRPGGEQLEVRGQHSVLAGLKRALGFTSGFVSLQFALDQ